MIDRDINDDIEWLLHGFQEENMSKNELKDIPSCPVEKASAFGLLSGSPFVTIPFPEKRYPRDPYIEKADLSFSGNFFKDDIALVPGSIVAVSLAFAFEHTGIYIGNGEFMELYGDGTINRVAKKEFIDGAYKRGDFPARTGINIYVASVKDRPVAADSAKKRAIELHEKVGRIGYNVLKNNCHMFTGFCIFGKDFQKNHGCRFFTNLTRMVVDELGLSINDFYWRVSDHHYS